MALAVGIPTAYIFLIPGHAFPVIQLPQSGNLLPIESTLLKYDVPFSEAVAYGENQTWKEAMSGPYIVIDISALQSQGYTPPQLPSLPANTLTSSWGYKSPPAQQQGGGGQQQQGGSGTGQTTTFTSQSPAFSFVYPSSWSVIQQTSDSVVVAPSSSQTEQFVVGFTQSLTASQYRTNFENALQQNGTIQVLSDKTSIIAGVQADQVAYSYTVSQTGNQYVIVVRYVDYNGYAFLIGYQVPNDNNAQTNVNQCEQIVSSFQF